ncbi:MAG: hypothetical protein A2Y89_01175, partial [Chloroflexi bacterium RBG_13_51_18]
DKENYILYRGKQNFIMLNSFPYNPGHLLIAPYRHTGNLEELTEAERNEHYELVCRSIAVLKKVMKPAGFNIGANLGSAAGAGIEDHFHSHIVPRWQGDNNFMPVLGEVKVGIEDHFHSHIVPRWQGDNNFMPVLGEVKV